MKPKPDACEPCATSPAAAGPLPPASVPSLSSGALFGSARELQIEHAGERYRLRITRLGKLILTK